MKHIVASGCSYTRIFPSMKKDVKYPSNKTIEIQQKYQWGYSEFLKDYLGDEYQLWNEGMPNNGNNVIVDSAIRRISLLLKDGVNPNDIIVLIQLSSQSRKGLFVPASQLKYDELNPYKTTFDLVHGYLDSTGEEQIKKDGYWYLGSQTSINKTNHIQKWFTQYSTTIWSEEMQHLSMLRDINYIQTYLKANNINNSLFFFMKNELIDGAYMFPNEKRDSDFYKNISFKKSLFGGKESTSTMSFITMNNIVPYIKNNKTLKEIYNSDYINYLYDTIDWDKFWFFESEATTKSGLWEWTIHNSNKDEHLFTWHEEESNFAEKQKTNVTKEETIDFLKTQPFLGFHLSSEMNEKFMKDVILKRISI